MVHYLGRAPRSGVVAGTLISPKQSLAGFSYCSSVFSHNCKMEKFSLHPMKKQDSIAIIDHCLYSSSEKISI